MEWVRREGVTRTSNGYTGIVTYDNILGGASFAETRIGKVRILECFLLAIFEVTEGFHYGPLYVDMTVLAFSQQSSVSKPSSARYSTPTL